MISVEEALSRILASLTATPVETVSLAEADGRTLAADIASRRTQPPADVSAMDGYAVRAGDVATVPATLRLVGHAAAGGHHEGTLAAGEAVRIFTGAPLPAGADAIVIQEDTERPDDAHVLVRESVSAGTYVRPAGLDFSAGDIGLEKGRRLGARDIGLAAAMNVPWLPVHRRPRVALLATGDEIVRPGEPAGEDQIVSSNALALAALVRACGGEAVDLGIARDRVDSLRETARGAAGCDMLVTLGGASVGEHDLVQEALAPDGLDVDFWRIAMRPGKPLMFGRFADMAMLGLPGNPVSSLVCGLIFLRPALRALAGLPQDDPLRTIRLGSDLGGNDRRQDYLRTEVTVRDGERVALPFARQDSSMLATIARADGLIVRPPHAPPVRAGELVPFLPFDQGLTGI